MQHRSAKAREGRDVRQIRRAADAGGHDDVARPHAAQAAVGKSYTRIPTARFPVIARAFERGAGPEIDFHRLDIGFQPVGELVLGKVKRPAGGERDVRQVVAVHLVVQLQARITQPPVVANAFFAVNHQGIHTQLPEASRRGDAGMAAAHHQYCRVATGKSYRLAPLVLPVRAVEVAREGRLLALCAQGSFFVALQVFQRGQQSPGHWRRGATGNIGVDSEADESRTVPAIGLEAQYRLERIRTGTLDHARRAALWIDHEVARPVRQARRPETPADLVAAAMRFDVPGQGQQIAPMAVGEEKRSQAIRIAIADGLVEAVEPHRDHSIYFRARMRCLLPGFTPVPGKSASLDR